MAANPSCRRLNNPFYNLHRLGIFFTASPRFADLLLVTGPVTYAMLGPLRATYEAMAEPRWVMAVGTCAVSGGIAEGGYACGHGLDGVIPVDVYLPGCPPNPGRDHAGAADVSRSRAATRERRPACRMTSWPPAFLAWLAAALIALTGRGVPLARVLLLLGCVAGIAAAILALPDGTSAVVLPTQLAGAAGLVSDEPRRAWLLGFGLAPAALACALATPAREGQAGWLFGAAISLIGALGVFGVRDGAGFLIAWEIMSFGGAMMILSEKLSADAGRPVLFMLGLLEVGAVALLVAILLLAVSGALFRLREHSATAAGDARRRRRWPPSASCWSSASAPSSACCRSTSGSRPPTAPAAARPAR